MSALNVLELISCVNLFRNEIGFFGRVPVDKIIVPVSVDGNAGARDHQGSWRDVDKCAA